MIDIQYLQNLQDVQSMKRMKAKQITYTKMKNDIKYLLVKMKEWKVAVYCIHATILLRATVYNAIDSQH